MTPDGASAGSGTQTLLGRQLSVNWWDFSARNTYSPPYGPPGEWVVRLDEAFGFWSGPSALSENGEISFGPDGKVSLHFRDQPGLSPFVVVRLRDLLEGVGMQVRYAVAINAAGEHQFTDWQPLTWDDARKGYVGIGPTSDGSLASGDYWGLVEVSNVDTSGFDLMDIRAGWANLGA